MSEQNVIEYFRSVVEDIVDEFALMSRLKGNSNIVSYEDHSVVPKKDGFGWDIYIRMELLTPLFTHIREHKMTVRDVIQLGIDICHALEVCQKYNIIHRDIKPENIFVSDIGTYKLGDFGIARQLGKTSSGVSKKGTFTYMAPELYKGLEYNLTVDIYSLGIVLYRFLNGNRSPFMPLAPQPIRYSDKEKANIMRISGQRMPKPQNAGGQLAEIVLKACAYNPSERYESAFELRKDLEELKIIDDSPFKYDNEILQFKDEYINEGTEFFIENERDDSDERTVYLFSNVEEATKENSELKETSNVVSDKPSNKSINKIINKMINWICFTCLLSLMPLFIYLFLSNFSDIDISTINKCITDFVYFGVTISVITIKEMLSFELQKKDKGIYTLALFIMICLLIFSAVIFGVMTMSDLGLLKVQIADEFLLNSVIIMATSSFLTGTAIQIWEGM